MDCVMGRSYFADIARLSRSVMAIVSLLTFAAKLSLVTWSAGRAKRCPRRVDRAGPQLQDSSPIHRAMKLDMPETPTFGRYAEIPDVEMTPAQQEGYRFLVETRGGPAGRARSGCITPS
jgi:hypothetical protein